MMKRNRYASVACLLSLLVLFHWPPVVARAQNTGGARFNRDQRLKYARFVPGEVLVKFRPGPMDEFLRTVRLPESLEALNRKYAVRGITPVFRAAADSASRDPSGWAGRVEKIRKRFPERSARAPLDAAIPDLSLWHRIKLPQGTDVTAAVEAYRKDPSVEQAQPNHTCVPYNMPPNDPFYSSRDSWGQGYDDLWGLKKIECEGAWRAFPAERDIGAGTIVAVVDTGVDYTHGDLQNNIWLNQGELKVGGGRFPDGLDADGDGNVGVKEVLAHIDDYNRDGVVSLKDLLWIPPLPLRNPFRNDLDNDGNGEVDDLVGWDFHFDFCDPSDFLGHGSHVAGTIAAVTDNSAGVSGVSWHSQIMPVREFTGAGDAAAPETNLADSIRYAVDNGADVINNSWGPDGRLPSDPIAEDAVRYAYRLGAVVVSAAGNYDDDAAYYSPNNMDEVITVAATTPDDEKTFFSNWGEKIDVCAPGGGYAGELRDPEDPDELIDSYNILSTMSNYSIIRIDLIREAGEEIEVSPGYCRLAGTSMACAHVSGLAALLLSAHPGWTNEAVMWHIKATADNIDDLNPGYEFRLGAGRINAAAALTAMPPAVSRLAVTGYEVDEDFGILRRGGDGDGMAEPGELITLRVHVRNTGIRPSGDFTAGLSADDPYVNIVVGSASLRGLRYGERAEAVYRFSVADDFPSDHDLEFTHTITHRGASERSTIVVHGKWRESFVDEGNRTGPWDGTRERPFRTIRQALARAVPFTRIYVARGTYRENIIVHNGSRLYPVREHKIKLYGGYSPLDGWDRDIRRNETLIDGGRNGSVVTFIGPECSGSTLSGFTVTNGRAWSGGGVLCLEASPILADNIIRDNHAGWAGGGICGLKGSSPEITGNTIVENSAEDGGGICYEASLQQGIISGNIISRNSSGNGGGMCFISDVDIPDLYYPALINNLITRNNALRGGGIFYSSPSPIVRNSIIWANTAPDEPQISVAPRRPGLPPSVFRSFLDRTLKLINNTIVNNSADESGGGFYCRHHSLPLVTYSDIEGGWAGDGAEGNIDRDPRFTMGPLGLFYLSQVAAGQITNSPCVDSGAPDPELIYGTTRTDGWRDTGIVDMGHHYPLFGLRIWLDGHEWLPEGLPGAEMGMGPMDTPLPPL